MIEKEKQSILLVDTDALNQQSIQDVLRDLDVEIVVSDSANSVIDLADQYDFALILFAIAPDNLESFEVSSQLNKIEKTRFIPVIFQDRKSVV